MKILNSFLFSLLVFTAALTTKVHATPAFYAGTASVDITPPVGTPLGGSGDIQRRQKALIDWFLQDKFATYFKPSEGILDPIRSKAFVLKNSQRTLVFISLDVVGVTADVADVLQTRLKKLGFDDVMVSATHTHSGPGTLAKSWLWQIMAMDKFRKDIYTQFIENIILSVEKAYNNLEPAELYATSFEAANLHNNRRHHPERIDNKANLLLAKNEKGEWLGGLVNYAIHGTIMRDSDLVFSADAPGGIERELESALQKEQGGNKRPTMVFINGAEGDITASYSGGSAGIKKTGEEFAELAMNALPIARKVDPNWEVRTIRVKMPKARINLGNCGVLIGKKPLNLNIFIGSNAAPRIATLSQIRLGDIYLMTWPGEATWALGEQTKALATAHGYADPWIMGLTNGHMAYFLTPEELTEGGYEPCVTLHGPKAGSTIVGAHEKILNTL